MKTQRFSKWLIGFMGIGCVSVFVVAQGCALTTYDCVEQGNCGKFTPFGAGGAGLMGDGGAGGSAGQGGSSGAAGMGGEGGGSCSDEIPNGWAGWFVLSKDTYGNAPKACTNGLMPTLYYHEKQSHPGCSAATSFHCDAPKVKCGPNILGDNCVLGGAAIPIEISDPSLGDTETCLNFNGTEATSPFDVIRRKNYDHCQQDNAPIFASCDCASSLGEKTPPWKQQILVCPAGQQTPCQQPGDSTTLCIAKPGDMGSCPAGLERSIYFGSFEDKRECGACSCTTVDCSGGTYDFYLGADCVGTGKPLPMTCVSRTDLGIADDNNNIFPLWSMRYTPATHEPMVTLGESMGEVTGKDPVTFCCTSAIQ